MKLLFTFIILLLTLCLGIWIDKKYGNNINNYLNSVPVIKQWLHKTGITLPSSSSKIAYCPSPKEIVTHANTPGSWHSHDLSWSVNFHDWTIPTQIGFMQAVFQADTNTLTCYYHWPDPKNPGTDLWMTVLLNPTLNQNISPMGRTWTNIGKNEQKCEAGDPLSCAFSLS